MATETNERDLSLFVNTSSDCSIIIKIDKASRQAYSFSHSLSRRYQSAREREREFSASHIESYLFALSSSFFASVRGASIHHRNYLHTLTSQFNHVRWTSQYHGSCDSTFRRFDSIFVHSLVVYFRMPPQKFKRSGQWMFVSLSFKNGFLLRFFPANVQKWSIRRSILSIGNITNTRNIDSSKNIERNISPIGSKCLLCFSS